MSSYLTVSLALDKTSLALELVLSTYLVGRSASCDVVVIDPSVALLHCSLMLKNSGYFIQSAASTSIWLNGIKINSSFLTHGDVITFSASQYPRLNFYEK